MAVRLEQLRLESGGRILIEVFDTETEVERIGVGDRAAKTFEDALENVTPVIHSLGERMASWGAAQTQIKFGIKVGADLNAFIAKASGEANFEVTLSWKPQN